MRKKPASKSRGALGRGIGKGKGGGLCHESVRLQEARVARVRLEEEEGGFPFLTDQVVLLGVCPNTKRTYQDARQRQPWSRKSRAEQRHRRRRQTVPQMALPIPWNEMLRFLDLSHSTSVACRRSSVVCRQRWSTRETRAQDELATPGNKGVTVLFFSSFAIGPDFDE